MSNKVTFEDIVMPKKGFLRGPFGGDLKKEIFVPRSDSTYKVYEQSVVLQHNSKLGRYFITKEYFDIKMHRFEVKPKDFLVSCSGANYGAIHQLEENIEKGVINQALLRIRLNNDVVDDNYFNYLFSHYIVNMIVGRKGDSTIPNFPAVSVIKKLKFELPDLNTQKKVGAFLKKIDTKIELNNKINTKLEKMAKTLYDYWFFQFDFPDENGKPYKSSGGKMIFNEDLKRKIPEGWEVKKISDLFTFQKGVEPGASEYKNNKESENHILFYRVGDIDGSSNTYVDSKAKNYNLVEETDVIITFDGSVGKMGFGLNGAYSGGLQKIYDQTGRFDNSMVYSLFRDERIVKTIHQYATGSIILHASGAIKHLSVPFNETKYLDFQKIIKPIFTKLIKNKSENQKLAELRDWLLPMLMNGQVTVN